MFAPLIINAAIPALGENGAAFKDVNRTAGGDETSSGIGYKTSSPEDINALRMEFTKLIIQYALSFLGVIFLVLVIWGGYDWMFAGGNEEKVTKAKQRIKMAVNGLIIILLAYIITNFIFTSMIQAPRPN